MTEPEDYVAAIIGHFCEVTGKLICAPTDYQVCGDWEVEGIPRQIVLAAMDEWAGVNQGKKWLRHAQLEWLSAIVSERYQQWRRAIGPQYGKVS